MQIQINTDNHIKGHESFTTDVSRTVEQAFGRFRDQITRVELHLSDMNGDKSGLDDKQCVLEVRLKGLQPIAVTDHHALLETAVSGAAAKMVRSIEKILEREHDRLRQRSGPAQHHQKIPNE